MIIVLAVIFAIAGGAGIYSYLSPQRTTMYVFNANYEAGTQLTSEMLTAVQVDSKIIMEGSSTDASSTFVTGATITEVLKKGQSIKMNVTEGLPLTNSLLSVSGGSKVEADMDPSKIAVTVSLSETTGVTNDLKESSRVNIYTIRNNAAVLILQNMRILSVNRDSNGAITGATVECDADQSLKLIYAASNSTIYFGLVESSGYQATEEAEPSYAPGN